MKVITNISNITDNSGTAPIVTFSNAVQTIVPTERHSTPRNANRVVICDQCGNCWVINTCNSNFSNWHNNCQCSSCNCFNNGCHRCGYHSCNCCCHNCGCCNNQNW